MHPGQHRDAFERALFDFCAALERTEVAVNHPARDAAIVITGKLPQLHDDQVIRPREQRVRKLFSWRAAAAQFDGTIPLEHNYYLVRSDKQLDRVMAGIEASPGVVWYTITDDALRRKLEQFCRQRGIQTLPVLDASVRMLSRHLGMEVSDRVAGQHALNEDYFKRIEAIDFALAHDDGQNVQGLKDADVVLLGVSRTSKTPTCVYLANRGVKAGNIPLVPGIPLPSVMTELSGPLVIGLKIGVERLLQIRGQRLMALNETSKMDYTDEEAVRAEVTEASRLFQRNKWPVIDVSRRSVEETAAAILNKLNATRGLI